MRPGQPALAGESLAVPNISLMGVRVLLVDDDRDTLDLFTNIVEETHAEVRVATSVAEALDMFEVWRPDVVVSDVEIPGEDGYGLIRRLRERTVVDGGAVPAVAVTAYGRLEDRVRLLAAGYNTHIPKPVEPAELVIVLAALTRRPAVDSAADEKGR